jgi:hypothetical protein
VMRLAAWYLSYQMMLSCSNHRCCCRLARTLNGCGCGVGACSLGPVFVPTLLRTHLPSFIPTCVLTDPCWFSFTMTV